MNKLILTAALSAVTATAVLAASPPAKPGKVAAKSMHCAVMAKNPVDVIGATKSKMYADHKGRRYFFCCAGCPEAFKKEPAKYAKADSIPTPKKP